MIASTAVIALEAELDSGARGNRRATLTGAGVFAADGETTWFEGLLLVAVYVLFASAFYFEGAA